MPFTYHPDAVGGTEVYVESLARGLQRRQVSALIAAPGKETASYEHAGVAVRRFAVPDQVKDIRELYGAGNAAAAREFVGILDEEQPDLVHLHAFTRAVSLRLLREVKSRGIKAVFTYHTPTVSCQRGTLMRWGDEVCDGKLSLSACSACALQALGLSKLNASILGRMPRSIGGVAGTARLSGGVWTALRMTELVHLRHLTFQALMQEVDQVIALCQWVKDLLSRNGVPAEKIAVSRHGLPQETETTATNSALLAPSPLRLAFLGRLDHTKGADILIQALRLLPEANVELSLYGIVQAGAAVEYLDRLKALAGDDSRIHFLPPVPSNKVISLLQKHHLLAVPSRWLETGPLVALEAFSAGIPVLGSNLGGIAEMVTNEVNGLLVETDSVQAWKQAISRCYEDKTLLEKLRRGIRPPRVMDAVASEMTLLYERILQEGGVYNPTSSRVEEIQVCI